MNPSLAISIMSYQKQPGRLFDDVKLSILYYFKSIFKRKFPSILTLGISKSIVSIVRWFIANHPQEHIGNVNHEPLFHKSLDLYTYSLRPLKRGFR